MTTRSQSLAPRRTLARKSTRPAACLFAHLTAALALSALTASAQSNTHTDHASPARPASPPSPPASAPALAAITAALQAKQFDQASTLCAAALRTAPRDPRLWTLQALAQQGLQQTAAAKTSYRKAVTLAPAYLPAWQGLAQLEYGTHDPAAHATLQHVVALAPGDAVAHAMLAALAFAQKDCATVDAEYSQTRGMADTRPDAATQWASCLMQQGHPEQAAAHLSTTLAAFPTSPTLRYDTALAQWRSGDKTTARQTLQPLVDDPHAGSDALVLAAQLAEEANDTQPALDLLRRAILADPKNRDAYLDFARLAYDHASVQVGIDMINLGLQQLPDDAELYFARGVLLAQNGKMDGTLADLDRAAKLDPKLTFVGTAQGIAASQAHRFAEAEQRLRQQTRQHPTEAAAWYLLAEALAEQPLEPGTPRYVEMVHAAERAVQLDPKSADAHSQLAAIYLRNNDPARAVAECNAALAVNADDPQTLYQLLLATRRTGQKEQLPGIVKRLVAAREAADLRDKSSRKQTLTEVPAPGAPGGAL